MMEFLNTHFLLGLLVAVSPDGMRMVAVGDTSEVFLFDIRSGYQKISTLKGPDFSFASNNFSWSQRFFFPATNDPSFSCSWNHSSTMFAVASQDGYVSVWDLRRPEKLAKLCAKQMASVRFPLLSPSLIAG